MFEVNASGDHIVEASWYGSVIVLYVTSMVSFYSPHVVEVSVLSICSIFRAFVAVLSIQSESYYSLIYMVCGVVYVYC